MPPVTTEKHCAAHSGLEARIADSKRRLERGDETIEKLWKAINDIRNRLLSRPSWIVVFILTALVAAVSMLGTALLHRTGSPAVPVPSVRQADQQPLASKLSGD